MTDDQVPPDRPVHRHAPSALELVAAVVALALPVIEHPWLAWLSGLAAVCLGASLVDRLAAWGWTGVARTFTALCVAAQAAVFPDTVGGAVLLALDGLALLVFLVAGGWAEAGGGRGQTTVSVMRRLDARRLVVAVPALGAVAAVTVVSPPPALVLVLAGMAAAVLVLRLARRDAG
jgi:hypothetical protein